MSSDAPGTGHRPAWPIRVFAYACYIFLIVPSLIVVPMSFGDKDELIFPPREFSLYLYKAYFFTSNWIDTTIVSLKVGVGSALIAVTLGFLAAYGIARGEFRGKKLLSGFLLSPMLTPAIVLALAFYLYLGVARMTGTISGLILCHAIVTMPFVIVTLLAGLKHIDPNLEVAATVMGSPRHITLTRITLPLLWPSIVSAGLFAFLISFDEVVISYFISDARTQTLPVKMYSSIHWEISPVLAAISTILTVLSLAICLGVAYLQKGK